MKRLILILLVFIPVSLFGADDPYTVAAYYYPWYGGEDNPHWPLGYAHRPWIGLYSSANPQVARQQIDLANEYGVDVFAVSWTGINSHSEKKFKAGFMKAPNLKNTKFCMLYETLIRVGKHEPPVDFNDPVVRNQFVDDFEYLARTYFSHPSYLKVDGRPVVNIYLTRTFRGEFAPVIQEIRSRLKALGFNPYLVADSMFYGRNDLYTIAQFDAVTAYNIFSSALLTQDINTTGELAKASRPFFWNFMYQIKDVRAEDTRKPVDFQPGVIPQFDARTRRSTDVALLALNKQEVVEMFTVAREVLDAKPSGPRIVWITSWNEWHEGTSIEPSVTGGQKYPGGNFGYDFLEAVSEVFQ